MSFSINTNILAMSALKNLGTISNNYSQSIERLSSGLRINSAEDDPAGLIASENLRSEIKSLDQAVRNNQDSINLAKTAEGGLDQIASLLKDAKTLAIASGNGAGLTETQLYANQNALGSILQSIDKVADNTTFGNEKLIGRTAGLTTNYGINEKIWYVDFSSGLFDGREITQDSPITVEMTVNADTAVLPGVQVYGSANDQIGQDGNFILNGIVFEYKATDTVQKIIDSINFRTIEHYITAEYNVGTNTIDLQTMYTGSFYIGLMDSNGIIGNVGESYAYSTVAAEANVTMNPDGQGDVTVTFTNDYETGWGSWLTDSHGNDVMLNDYYARVGTGDGPFSAGSVTFEAARFQTGTDANSTSTFNFTDFRVKNLGAGVVDGKNLSSVDITTVAGASEAQQIIDKAIQEVDDKRGSLGAFSKYSLESSISSLSTTMTSLSATESSIRDADVAEEITEFTKSQILFESASSVLAQANAAPYSVLSLITDMNVSSVNYSSGYSGGSIYAYA